jgi:hypothetical protein
MPAQHHGNILVPRRVLNRQRHFFRSSSMPTQIVMDHSGDSRHAFDAADTEAVARAERRFKELTGAGFLAAARIADGESRRITQFDPTIEETLFFPRLVGG